MEIHDIKSQIWFQTTRCYVRFAPRAGWYWNLRSTTWCESNLGILPSALIENSFLGKTPSSIVLRFIVYYRRCMIHVMTIFFRSVLALQASNQDPSLLDQISKNVTRQGITPATLNYLRVTFHRWSIVSRWIMNCSILYQEKDNSASFCSLRLWNTRKEIFILIFLLAVCYSGTDARADVPTQGLRS